MIPCLQKKTDEFDYCVVSSPVGELLLAATSRGLRALQWTAQPEQLQEIQSLGYAVADTQQRNPHLRQAKMELEEYFAGSRTHFSVELDVIGTPFQKRAWRLLREIPFGETRSYGSQAEALGGKRFSRAAGSANGKNPIGIIVPCHRVIGSDGKLRGFAGGLSTKQKLLNHEREVGQKLERSGALPQ